MDPRAGMAMVLREEFLPLLGIKPRLSDPGSLLMRLGGPPSRYGHGAKGRISTLVRNHTPIQLEACLRDPGSLLLPLRVQQTYEGLGCCLETFYKKEKKMCN